VNNAGLTRDGLFLRMSDEAWQQVIDTNLGAAFRCARAVARSMMKARSGRIVNVSSVVGPDGQRRAGELRGLQGRLLGFTKSLAASWPPRNVTVNAVCPGSSRPT